MILLQCERVEQRISSASLSGLVPGNNAVSGFAVKLGPRSRPFCSSCKFRSLYLQVPAGAYSLRIARGSWESQFVVVRKGSSMALAWIRNSQGTTRVPGGIS